MELYDNEAVYDEQISPLMTKIIAVCREHRIPMIASFTYENCEERGQGRCTTHLPFDGRKDELNERAHGLIRNGGHQIMTMAITEPAK